MLCSQQDGAILGPKAVLAPPCWPQECLVLLAFFFSAWAGHGSGGGFVPLVAISVQRMKIQLHDPGLWCGQSYLRAELLDETLGPYEMENLERSMDKVLLEMNSDTRTESCTPLQVFPAKFQVRKIQKTLTDTPGL